MSKRFLASLVLLGGLLFVGLFGPAVVPVSAASAANCSGSSAGFLSFPTWYKYLDHTYSDAKGCELQFNFPDDIGKVLLALVEILMRIVGLVSVGFVVYGGVRYTMSQGEPDRTKQAKNTIINALVGAGVAIVATGIVNLIARSLI
jgi:hypothetical protein